MRSTLIVMALLGLTLSSCSNATNDKLPKKKQYKYYCIMHPDLGSDKPDVCPKCGMQLVEREANK